VSPPLAFPTIYIPPPPPEVPPTAYIPEGPLPPNFPPVAYTAHGSVWILRYEDGSLREEFLAGPFEGQPLQMALSPGGNALALNTEVGAPPILLYIIGLDGSMKLLGIPDHCWETVFHAWGPDGTEVLASILDLGGGLLRVDDGTFRRITSKEFPYMHCGAGATISPDGRYIFCSEMLPLARVEVGKGEPDKVEVLVSEKRPRPGIYARNFTWSPDGRHAVFTWDKLVQLRYGEGQLWLMDADGSNLRPLGRDDTYDFDPAWSPDGKTIAFARRENPPDDLAPIFDPTALVSSLYLLDVESGKERLLLSSEGKFAHWDPEWLPDGSGLVFLSDRGGEANLYFIRPDGTGLQQLTRQGGLTGEIALLKP